MQSSGTYSYNPHFSHIYVEREALDYPDTKAVLDKFSSAEIVTIDHYKDVFSRSGQEWRAQKKSQKLILAVRRDKFLYEGTDIAPDFGNRRFFYNALVLNCLYDCEYCYLQGMFPSANAVMFVNNHDYFKAVNRELTNGSMYLAISYDTDLLGFESIIPDGKRWIEFARDKTDLTVELRTKSANYRAISSLQPPENVVLAWTLSPAEIGKKHEPKTPPLRSRLQAVKKALKDGWPVRLCFDPLLRVPNWREHYGGMIDKTADEISLHEIRDFSVGVFRMSSHFLREMRKQRSDTELLYYPYETKNGVVTYPDEAKNEMEHYVLERLSKKVNPEKIDLL